MNTIIKKALQEPLFYFFLIGGLLFMLMSAEEVQSEKQLTTNAQAPEWMQTQLEGEFKEKFARTPGQREQQALALQAEYNMLLLEKARTLKLEQKDAAIAKKLIEKMEYIITASAIENEPTEAELLAYYKTHKENYCEKKALTFSHIYLKEKNYENTTTLLELVKLIELSPQEASMFGDRFDGSSEIKDASKETLMKQFGNYFVQKLMMLEKGYWHKAIESANGLHLIYVSAFETGIELEFEEVQERVYADYKEMLLSREKQNIYKQLQVNK